MSTAIPIEIPRPDPEADPNAPVTIERVWGVRYQSGSPPALAVTATGAIGTAYVPLDDVPALPKWWRKVAADRLHRKAFQVLSGHTGRPARCRQCDPWGNPPPAPHAADYHRKTRNRSN